MVPRGTFVVSDPRKVRARGRAAPESPAVAAVAVAVAAMTTTTHSTSAVAAFVAGAFVAGAVAATALRRRVRGDDFGDVVGVGGGGVGRGGGDAVRCVNVERDVGGVRGVATVPSTSAFDMSDEIFARAVYAQCAVFRRMRAERGAGRVRRRRRARWCGFTRGAYDFEKWRREVTGDRFRSGEFEFVE